MVSEIGCETCVSEEDALLPDKIVSQEVIRNQETLEIGCETHVSEEDTLLADKIVSREVIQNQATLEIGCETHVSEEDTLLLDKKDTSYTPCDIEFQVLTMKSSSLDNVSVIIILLYNIHNDIVKQTI